MRLRVGAATDIGRVRDLNEDVYMIRPDRGLFVVCDGMGGCPAGEVASQMAAEAIVSHFDRPAAAPAHPANGQPYLAQTNRLAEAVQQSNAFIYEQARKDPRQANMGTTVVGALVAGQIVSVAHVGDSRAYLWHNDRLEPLTRDHSLAQARVRAGLMNEADSGHSEQQNILLRVVGREPEIEVDVTEVAVQSGDYLLLCSDGLTRMVPESAVGCAIVDLRHPQRICDYLIAVANRNGGADNVTVVVVEMLDSWWLNVTDRWRRYVWSASRWQA